MLMVPTVELPPTMPLTFQMTLVSEAFCTVAVNWTVPEVVTVLLVIFRSIVTCELEGWFPKGEVAQPATRKVKMAASTALAWNVLRFANFDMNRRPRLNAKNACNGWGAASGAGCYMGAQKV